MHNDLWCRLRRLFGPRDDAVTSVTEKSDELERKRVQIDRMLADVAEVRARQEAPHGHR